LYRYITKPWDPDELVETLHQAAQRYEEIAERRRLLKDTREYVQQARELAEGWRDAGGQPAVATGLDDFIKAGDRLTERLERAMREPPATGKGE
jgi:hypothetical protein